MTKIIVNTKKDYTNKTWEVGDYVKSSSTSIGIITRTNKGTFLMTRLDNDCKGNQTKEYNSLEGLQEWLDNWTYVPEVSINF